MQPIYCPPPSAGRPQDARSGPIATITTHICCCCEGSAKMLQSLRKTRYGAVAAVLLAPFRCLMTKSKSLSTNHLAVNALWSRRGIPGGNPPSTAISTPICGLDEQERNLLHTHTPIEVVSSILHPSLRLITR